MPSRSASEGAAFNCERRAKASFKTAGAGDTRNAEHLLRKAAGSKYGPPRKGLCTPTIGKPWANSA